tara:strand:- start:3209 stop:4288 length:1080 start_codon:yes stop_codon:yes gene_type:complete
MKFKTTFNRVIKESSYYSERLNPKFWKDYKFDDTVRRKLLLIVDDFLENLAIDEIITDIQLTGSLSNYNYTPYSDLDVHILLDFANINQNEELVKRALDGKRFIWNLRHEIMIRGHEVELYFQDIHDVHNSTGVFSLKKNKWNVTPIYDPPNIDERSVDEKTARYENDIAKLKKYLEGTNTPKESELLYKRARALKLKIKKMRGEELHQGGEYSVGNLTFKNLRNSGAIGALIDLTHVSYDQIYNEVAMSTQISKATKIDTGMPKVKTGPRTQKMMTGMTRDSQNMLPASHRVDPTLHPKVETLRKKKRGKVIISDIDRQNICQAYHIKNLKKDKPRKLGRSGISMQWDTLLNSYVLEK